MKCPSPFGWRSTRSHWARGVSLDPMHREKRRGPGPDPSGAARTATGARPLKLSASKLTSDSSGEQERSRAHAFPIRVSTSKQRVAIFDAIRPRGDTKWEKRLGLTALASRHHVSRAFSPWSDGNRPGSQRGDTSPAVTRASEVLVASKAAARGETAAFETTVFDVWTAWS